jgi:hypothetical protein
MTTKRMPSTMLYVGFLLLLAGCGGGRGVSGTPAVDSPAQSRIAPPVLAQPQARTVAQEIAAIEASQAPAGVDPARCTHGTATSSSPPRRWASAIPSRTSTCTATTVAATGSNGAT